METSAATFVSWRTFASVWSTRTLHSWREAPALALYNWSAEEWTPLSEPEFGENPITDPDKLISEDGLVRVRLAVSDLSKGSCYMVGMGFEGRRGL